LLLWGGSASFFLHKNGEARTALPKRNVTIPGSGDNDFFSCGVLDESGYLYLISSNSLLLKVDAATMKITKSFTLPPPLAGQCRYGKPALHFAETNLKCSAAVLDAARGLVYFGLGSPLKSSNILSVRLSDLLIVGVVILPEGTRLSNGGFISGLADYAYFG